MLGRDEFDGLPSAGRGFELPEGRLLTLGRLLLPGLELKSGRPLLGRLLTPGRRLLLPGLALKEGRLPWLLLLNAPLGRPLLGRLAW